MRIAQITDLHVTSDEQGMRRFVDSNANAAHAVRQLVEHPARPDVVIATGDLVDVGIESEYALLHKVLEPIDRPLYLLPGNHDDWREMERLFPEWVPAEHADGHLSYAVDDYDVRLVGLDTTVFGEAGGSFPDDRAEWLDTTLGAAPERPTLLFMHHPPFATGIWWMDTIGLDGKERFAEVLSGHPQVGLVVCGHIHRSIQTRIANAVVSVCPSTAHQIGFAWDRGDPPMVTDEQSGFQIHSHTGEGFVTHTAALPWNGRTRDISGML